VNKIKNRFHLQPEIYKNFLEILQTYQREQLRISEVYSQVTHLFREAPDLLDDFKQFLPDTSQPRTETAHDDHGQQPQHLPPVGNFAPPTTGAVGTRDREKRKKDSYQPTNSGSYNIDSGIPMSNMRGAGPLSTSSAKARSKRDVSPSLVPAAPEALPPPSKASNIYEEIAFFDKVKKFLPNKQTYSEFLKVLNLFSQKIIDKNTLVERIDGFIGSNKDLMDWFKRFVKYEGKPLHIDNIAFKKHNLDLNQCKNYGPSYRLLPKSETYMPCSGRDEMCWEVLNDEWVVHPTWASEDSGFVAHRKNQYEEILYRVEEERQEYDYYIGANLRTIQTLETIANRIANMSTEEKLAFRLPPGLGHSSKIYQKIIKKIYDKEKGQEVIDALHNNPAVALPIVLKRLKQKDEEWRRAHREWNKVWRETEQKVFYKSLDHIGLTFKQTDKKQLTTRNLLAEITTVKAEQSSKRRNPTLPLPKSQLNYTIKDNEIILDVLLLVFNFLEHGGSYSSSDRDKMDAFLRSFLTLFFSLPPNFISDKFPEGGHHSKSQSPDANGDSPSDSSVSIVNGSRKRQREVTGDLLKDVLKRAKTSRLANGRDAYEDDGSETPEPGSPSEDKGSTKGLDDGEELAAAFDKIGESEFAWLKYADSPKSGKDFADSGKEKERHVFNLFGNTNIYVLMRLFVVLYERLEQVKSYEGAVSKEIESSGKVDFALELNLYDTKLADMGLQFSSKDVYGQLLSLCEKLIEGEVEHQWFEETIRQAYRNRAYKLYTIDKVVQSFVKHVHAVLTDQRSYDVLMLFQADRSEPTSSVKKQIAYRMQAKKIIGPEESLFRIDWDTETRRLGFQSFGTYDLTMKDITREDEKWNYYLTSYMMSVPTEGVPLDQIKPPLLYRSLIDEIDESFSFKVIEQGLMARVCQNTYKLFFESGTVDFFTRPSPDWYSGRTPQVLQSRKERLEAFLEGPEGWKNELTETQVEDAEQRLKLLDESGASSYRDYKPIVVEVTAEKGADDEPLPEAENPDQIHENDATGESNDKPTEAEADAEATADVMAVDEKEPHKDVEEQAKSSDAELAVEEEESVSMNGGNEPAGECNESKESEQEGVEKNIASVDAADSNRTAAAADASLPKESDSTTLPDEIGNEDEPKQEMTADA
jgi:paired amphipathic helix protein Sin3a